MPAAITEEQRRLEENYSNKTNWLKWEPYLSERQWATVRAASHQTRWTGLIAGIIDKLK